MLQPAKEERKERKKWVKATQMFGEEGPGVTLNGRGPPVAKKIDGEGKACCVFHSSSSGSPCSKALPGQGAHLGLGGVWDSSLGGLGILGWDSGFIHHLTSTDEPGWKLELGACLVGDWGPGLSEVLLRALWGPSLGT